MSPRDERKVKLVEGQLGLGWEQSEPDLPSGIIYRCRSCLSTHVVGPIKRTVDPRWVHATCIDCGERVIADVVVKPTPSSETESETR